MPRTTTATAATPPATPSARQAEHIRQTRGRKRISSAAGRYYDLDEVFESLNTRFFHGLMARPVLTWSTSTPAACSATTMPRTTPSSSARSSTAPARPALRSRVSPLPRDAAPQTSCQREGRPPLRPLPRVPDRRKTLPPPRGSEGLPQAALIFAGSGIGSAFVPRTTAINIAPATADPSAAACALLVAYS